MRQATQARPRARRQRFAPGASPQKRGDVETVVFHFFQLGQKYMDHANMVVVSGMFFLFFTPIYLGKISDLTHTFQMG